MPGSPPLLRRVRPDEAGAISLLMLRSKRVWGYSELGFGSDPNAEAFYMHLGARRLETIASNVIPGRTYPRMRYRL